MPPRLQVAAGEDHGLRETVAGLYALVMLGSFMHAISDSDKTAELAVGGLVALTHLPLTGVAWYPDGADSEPQVVVRCSGARGMLAGADGPLGRLCAGLPDSRPTRLEAAQLPEVLRMAGAQVLLALPLRVSTECLGFLFAGGERGSIPQDLTLIQALGAQTSTALYVARLQAREAGRVRELGQLTAVLREQGDLLSRALLTEEELIDLVLRGQDAGAIVDHLGQQIGAPVWLLDADRRVVAHSPGWRDQAAPFPREPALRRALDGHRPDRDPCSVEMATSKGPQSFLVQSVSTDRETYGFLLVGSTALQGVNRTTFQGGRQALALRLLIERSVADAEARAGRDLLQDALLHSSGAHTHAALASRLGYDRNGPAVVLALRIRPRGGQTETQNALRRVTSVIRDELRVNGPGVVGVIGTETVVILRPECAESFVHRVLERLATVAPELSAAIGLSDPQPGLSDLGPAYREAITAVALAERGVGGPLRFGDLGLHRLLFDAEHTDRIEEHIERWIGPLVRYDAEHHAALVQTLACALGGEGQQGIARQLSIHPSTLKYRLHRIGEILQLDYTHPDARFNIELALRLAQGLSDIQKR